MRRLVPSPKFKRALRKFVKNNPDLAERVEKTLVLMKVDVFDPVLGTHKLQGDLYGLNACTCGYDCRIIFGISKDPKTKEEAILLFSVGTHDKVY